MLPWWLRRERIHLQCRRAWFDPWVRKIPWRRAWQHSPVFLPGESPRTEKLQSMGLQRVWHHWEMKHIHQEPRSKVLRKLFQDHVEITGRDCIWIQAAAECVFWTRPHERSFVSLVFLFLKIMLGKNKQSPLPKFNKNCSLAISLTFLFPNLLYLYSNHGWKK